MFDNHDCDKPKCLVSCVDVKTGSCKCFLFTFYYLLLVCECGCFVNDLCVCLVQFWLYDLDLLNGHFNCHKLFTNDITGFEPTIHSISTIFTK